MTCLYVWQRVCHIVGDPLMTHGAGQADPILWVLVQKSEQEMLHGVAHEDVLGECQRGVADLTVEPKDGVRFEGDSACSSIDCQYWQPASQMHSKPDA